MQKIAHCLLIFLLSLTAHKWAHSFSWYSQDANNKTTLHVALFLSSTCPYCHQADVFFKDLENNSSSIKLQRYFINQDKEALVQFNLFLNREELHDFSVPSIFFCDSRWLGFEEKTMGKNLVDAMSYCKKQIEKQGALTPETITVLKRLANAHTLNAKITEPPTLAYYLLMTPLIDALSPCALFLMLSFIALLILQKNTQEQLATGLFFIVALGSAHYFQQIYPGLFYQSLSLLRGIAGVVGLISLYALWQYYKEKSRTYTGVIIAFLLGFMVAAYQHTCLMNWSYLFEQWLNGQNHLSSIKTGYRIIYHMMFLLPSILFLLFYVGLSRFIFFRKFTQRLNNAALLFILGIALLLIIHPFTLASMISSLILLLLVLSLAYALGLKKE